MAFLFFTAAEVVALLDDFPQAADRGSRRAEQRHLRQRLARWGRFALRGAQIDGDQHRAKRQAVVAPVDIAAVLNDALDLIGRGQQAAGHGRSCSEEGSRGADEEEKDEVRAHDDHGFRMSIMVESRDPAEVFLKMH